ncbi:MAG: hypothetical protein KKB31_04670 [Nanoarchaeota archaeon]|nr:hypothetical protein [Nanoarchaeota archaeon]
MKGKLVSLLLAGSLLISPPAFAKEKKPKIIPKATVVEKFQADSLRTFPGIVEVTVRKATFGKNKWQYSFSGGTEWKNSGGGIAEKTKGVCEELEEKLSGQEGQEQIVYRLPPEKEYMPQKEFEKVLECLGVQDYWIYNATSENDFFFSK